jgi:hypothetical protein
MPCHVYGQGSLQTTKILPDNEVFITEADSRENVTSFAAFFLAKN